MDHNLKIRTKIISDLLAGFGSSASGTPEQIIGSYLMAIDGLATPYVAEAARRLLSGLVPTTSASFAPSPTQLAMEARRLQGEHGEQMARVRRERAQIEHRPEPLDPAEVERRKAFVADRLASLKHMPTADTRQKFTDLPPQTAAEWLDEQRKNPPQAVEVSDELKSILNGETT